MGFPNCKYSKTKRKAKSTDIKKVIMYLVQIKINSVSRKEMALTLITIKSRYSLELIFFSLVEFLSFSLNPRCLLASVRVLATFVLKWRRRGHEKGSSE